MMTSKRHPASYRDPDGFIFEYQEKFYRQVNQRYAVDYKLFKESGLYDHLVKENKLLEHTEVHDCVAEEINWHKTLLPRQLKLLSYPYEWCFSQWKDAALLTLKIATISIEHGMLLKDATPFNIQFVDGSPVWIDTLSFEKYDFTKPWIAYRQFVECFIAPLLLAQYQSQELLKIFEIYPEGIPLKILAKLLPFKSRFNINILMHIFLPASLSGKKIKSTTNFTRLKLLNIIYNLHSFVKSINIKSVNTNWNNYYEETVLNDEYVDEKIKCLNDWMSLLPFGSAIDIGTNTGLFALKAAGKGIPTIAVDADIDCIDKLYNTCKKNKIHNLLPLCVDIINPSPAIGWDNNERETFFHRVQADLCLALALVHHLTIGKNVSFTQLAVTFGKLATWLIIEFIPKTDPKVKLLLENRRDIFDSYNEISFKNAFETVFTIEKRWPMTNTDRILFFMKRK
jgi:hypothetical protein